DELDNLLSRLLVPRSTSADHCLVRRWFVSQRHKKRGTGTHTPLGCGRKCRLLSLLIGIAIATRDKHTKAMMNVGDNALRSGDVEAATSTHGHFAHIGSLLGPARNHGAHEVARLEPLDALVLLGAGTREPVFVHAAHLSAA